MKKQILIIILLLLNSLIVLVPVDNSIIQVENVVADAIKPVVETASYSDGIGYDFLDDGDILHIWNTEDNYYFDVDSGIQLTNHYMQYWTHNVMMLGYYADDIWNLLYRTDELSGFSRSIDTDDYTYINVTMWKDLSYSSYDFRLAIVYYLELNDENLTVIPYIKNLGIEIPFVLAFGWELKDIHIDMTEEYDQIYINNVTSYLLNQTLDESYVGNDTDGVFYLQNNNSGNINKDLYLKWNPSLTYLLTVESRVGQYNAPVTLFIRVGSLAVGQEKFTKMYWHDSTETIRPNAIGFITDWKADPSYDENWENVDDVVADDDVTDNYVWTASGHQNKKDVYHFADTTSTGTISNVRFYFKARQGDATHRVRPICYIDSTYYYGSWVTVSQNPIWTVYNTGSLWNNNPDTSSAWTWDEIDGAQFGYEGEQQSNTVHNPRVTQCYATVSYYLDTIAPTPDPLTWSSEPSPDSTTAISMICTQATDNYFPSNELSYQFDETTGHAGATDSGWQSDDLTYTDSGLSENTDYTYRCRVRDGVPNTGDYSSSVTIYTLATAPSDGEFLIDNYESSWMNMSVLDVDNYPTGDLTGAYFECVTGSGVGGTDSGWVNAVSSGRYYYNATGLDGGELFGYKVRYRNGDGVVTTYTSEKQETTTYEVRTNDATNVEETTATLEGYPSGIDGVNCGFWYNTSTTNNSDFGINITVSGTFDSEEKFTNALANLTSGEYYYVRAWMYKAGIDFNSSVDETYFLTKPYAPSNASASIFENNISITWDNATINVTNRTNHVRYKTTGYPTSITDGILLYNDSSLNSSVVYWYNPSVTYYFSIWTYINESGSPSLFQFSSSSNNSNILGSTKPTDLTVTDYNDTKINLSWIKGDNDTTITRKIGSYPIHSNDGTSVYNGSLETHTDTGLTPNTHYFYRAWNWNGTDNSSGYTNISHWTAPQPPQNVTTETTVTGGVSMDLIISWDNGTGANRSVVRRSYTSQPILPIDGTEIYNSTLNTTTDSNIIESAFYTVFSYNTTTGLFSSGIIVTWYVIYINCYDEETNESLWFDVFISNQDGSQTYTSVDNTNPHYLNTSTLPTGDDVKIIVSAASNYSDKTETFTGYPPDENYTITYVVLLQTPDSKSSTNVTCINEGDDAHSYPSFTLDDDLITILPDNADKFTKIFVNYTHEEYGSRLYYRDIEDVGFFILNAYLPPTEDKELYLLEVIDEADNTVDDAYIEVKRSVNGTYVIISRLLTDANGQADLDLISGRNYIFIISKEGYVTENASWTPGTEIFTHTFKIIWEVIPFEPDTFGDIIDFYGMLYENNTMRVTFYDLDNGMSNSHFIVYEDYNNTLTYMGEYNGTTSNDITFWINVTNATRLHTIVLYMNHSTLGEIINYRIVVYPVHIDRDEGTWLENLIISVVGDFTFGYIVSFLWYLPCVLLIVGMASIKHPGIGILAAGLYSVWITWYIEVPGEAKVLAFASIAIVTGFITLFLVKGKEAIH